MRSVKILTIESDLGAGRKGAKLGPQALLKQLRGKAKLPFSLAENIRLENQSPKQTDQTFEIAKHLDQIIAFYSSIYTECAGLLKSGGFPFVLSGDHSSAAAIIAALKDSNPEKRLGVIWIDAHADMHTPFTTPSGNMHGMPLAIALGITNEGRAKNTLSAEQRKAWKSLIEMGETTQTPKLQADNLVFISLRDYEQEEFDLLNELNIKFFNPNVIKELGIKTVADFTLEQLSGCDAVFVSFDADSLNPELSIGTGTPSPGGLSADEAAYLLQRFWNEPKTIAFEVTEINPLLDREKPMEELVASILEKALK